MKHIWAVGLDLWTKFDDVCRKHGLKYYAAYGTLLGAVWHHGFIPWDDGIDLCMMRDDYEKLKKIATQHLFENLTLENFGQSDLVEYYCDEVCENDRYFPKDVFLETIYMAKRRYFIVIVSEFGT